MRMLYYPFLRQKGGHCQIRHCARTRRDDAVQYLQLDEESEKLFRELTSAFWPGPLMVAKASDKVPSVVSAGTGFIGVRCPNHPLALALLDAADVQILLPVPTRSGT